MSLIGRVKGANKDEKRDLASFVSLKFHCALSALFVCVCTCMPIRIRTYVCVHVCMCLLMYRKLYSVLYRLYVGFLLSHEKHYLV